MRAPTEDAKTITGVRYEIRPSQHHRRSIRLKGYDYSQAGVYFVTICLQHGLCLFGRVVDGEMNCNTAGEMAFQTWHDLSNRFPYINLDAFVIMPNHIHGIILITDLAPTRSAPTSLAQIIGAYKSISTTVYIDGVKNLGWTPFSGRLWQRNYYEHIIRNERSLNAIRQYIEGNPASWLEDKLHPAAPPNSFNQTWIRS